MAMTVAELDVFLSQPHVAVLATCDSEQRPHQVPIWYLWCGGAALLLTARESKKWRNILENPHVSLCVDTKEAPYLAAVLHGETEEAPEMDYPSLLLELAVHYLGERAGRRYAEQSGPRDSSSNVVFRLRPARIVQAGS